MEPVGCGWPLDGGGAPDPWREGAVLVLVDAPPCDHSEPPSRMAPDEGTVVEVDVDVDVVVLIVDVLCDEVSGTITWTWSASLAAPNSLCLIHSPATVPGTVARPVNVRRAAITRTIRRSMSRNRRTVRCLPGEDWTGASPRVMTGTSSSVVTQVGALVSFWLARSEALTPSVPGIRPRCRPPRCSTCRVEA
jgi:hypothetical protein